MIELRNISKHFGGVRALTDVSLRIDRGHVHGLMGENGAGKSTLGKVLSGIHTPDTGEILLDGKPHRFRSPADALAAGVGMVHQELAFCPDLSVAENLCMGHYPRRRGLVDRAAMRMRASQLLQEIGLSIDVDRSMRDLSTAQEQGVQIAAAVGTNARVIVFDEPTASLSARESEARSQTKSGAGQGEASRSEGQTCRQGKGRACKSKARRQGKGQTRRAQEQPLTCRVAARR